MRGYSHNCILTQLYTFAKPKISANNADHHPLNIQKPALPNRQETGYLY